MVNRQEAFRARRTSPSRSTSPTTIAQMAAFVWIVAGFWHITRVAGLVAMLVHSAGYMRVEEPREPG
jgi:hypothetical protein